LSLDRRLGLALTLVAVAWLWLVRTYIPDPGAEWPGPRGFPLLLGAMLALLGLTMAVKPGGEMSPAPTRREVGVAAGTFGLLILYAFLLDTMGFVIATPVVIALTLWSVLRVRRWGMVVSLAIGFTLGCWLIFTALLGTPLPRGTWEILSVL